jgi:hypothetical protein
MALRAQRTAVPHELVSPPVIDDPVDVDLMRAIGALPPMQRASARQQPFADNALRLGKRPFLRKRPILADLHAFDVLGVDQQVLVVQAKPEPRNIAMTRRDTHKRPRRITPNGKEPSNGNRSFGPGTSTADVPRI